MKCLVRPPGCRSLSIYQSYLADQAWTDLFEVPTGLGKTAAVTLVSH
jgi:hypothetical protein